MVYKEQSLFDYFNMQLRSTGATDQVSDDALLYLVLLLTDNARARPEDHPGTLTEMFAEAASAPPQHAAMSYRKLGDQALYVVGYYTESLTRKVVGPQFYMDMGSSAYLRAHRWLGGSFGDLFGELAARFGVCTDLLRRVRDAHEKDWQEQMLLPKPTSQACSE